MTKVLILDESGTIDTDHKVERYFVLGGILYNLDNLEYIKSKLLPSFDSYKKILKVSELKSNKMTSRKHHHNLIYGAALGLIDSIEQIKPILYILDKSSSYLIKSYDKKSFKYNKLIEFLIKDLIDEGLINNEDKILILIDYLDLSEKEHENFKNWLPSNYQIVDRVEMGKSEEFIFIQAADLISGIPKLKGVSPRQIKSDPKLNILSSCYLNVFPRSKACDILLDVPVDDDR